MTYPVRILFIFALFQIFLLGGCTTMVASVYKDEAYSTRLTETAVVWMPPANLRTTISRVGYGGIAPGPLSDKEKSQLQGGITELLVLFSEQAPSAIEKALTASQIRVASQEAPPTTQLSIFPSEAEIQCAALGCQHSLWIRVTLSDNLTKKTIWWASFKVGAPLILSPVKADKSVIQNFTDTVVTELKKSKLL